MTTQALLFGWKGRGRTAPFNRRDRYGIDHSERETPRFPVAQVQDVTERIKQALDQWRLNANDLAICGGITESDIIFAETCLELGARVGMMIREPIADERSIPFWPVLESSRWHDRLHDLIVQPGDRKEVWSDTKHLGVPHAESGGKDPKAFVTMRHRQWLINTAKIEATAVMKLADESPKSQGMKLHGLFLWDGSSGHDDPEGLSNFIREVNEFEGYTGQVKIISPFEGKPTT